MKRLNIYWNPCSPLPLWIQCITITIFHMWGCEFVIYFDAQKINKNGGLKSGYEIVELSCFVILAIIYSSLFYGVMRGIRKYLVPSLYALVAQIFHVVYLAIIELVSYVPVDQSSAKHTFLILGLAVVIFGTFLCFWIIVWSHFLELGKIDQGSHDKVYGPKSPLRNNNVNAKNYV